MQFLQFFLCITLLLLYRNVSRSAFLCELNQANPFKVALTSTVDIAGKGNFTTIQSAVDSIPSGNTKWMRIQILAGVYEEKVRITYDKTCIFLDGAGSRETFIEWDGHESTNTSATFTSYAENLVVKGIGFKGKDSADDPSGFVFKDCVVLGEGKAYLGRAWRAFSRVIIANSKLSDIVVPVGWDAWQFVGHEDQLTYAEVDNSGPGADTSKRVPWEKKLSEAQGKDSADDPSGFVFKDCVVLGEGKAYLGRAWRAFSRVIIANSKLSDIVVPVGWDAWQFVGHEDQLTYAEVDNSGPGADTSKRVPWEKKLSEAFLPGGLSNTLGTCGISSSSKSIGSRVGDEDVVSSLPLFGLCS
nr:putative pectinesterase 29 [Quercus suber]